MAVEAAAGPAVVVEVGVTPKPNRGGLFLRPKLTRRSLLSRTSALPQRSVLLSVGIPSQVPPDWIVGGAIGLWPMLAAYQNFSHFFLLSLKIGQISCFGKSLAFQPPKHILFYLEEPNRLPSPTRINSFVCQYGPAD